MNTKLSTPPVFGWETSSWNASGCELEREINFDFKNQCIAQLAKAAQQYEQVNKSSLVRNLEAAAKSAAKLSISLQEMQCDFLQMHINQAKAQNLGEVTNTKVEGLQAELDSLKEKIRRLKNKTGFTETESNSAEAGDVNATSMNDQLNKLEQDPFIKDLPFGLGTRTINKLREDAPINSIFTRNVDKIASYIPITGTSRGLGKFYQIYKYWPEFSAVAENRNWYIFRVGVETLSLGFLLLIPDLLVTLYNTYPAATKTTQQAPLIT